MFEIYWFSKIEKNILGMEFHHPQLTNSYLSEGLVETTNQILILRVFLYGVLHQVEISWRTSQAPNLSDLRNPFSLLAENSL